MKYLIRYALWAIVLVSCSNVDENLFVTTIKSRKDLAISGFDRVPGVDVEMHAKIMDSLIVSFQFDNERLAYKHWYIKIDTILPDERSIQRLISPYTLSWVTPIGVVHNPLLNENTLLFCLVNKNRDMLVCRTTQDEEGMYLMMTYEYPIKR